MARRKAGDKKELNKKNRTASENVPNVQADQYSIAFEKLEIGGDAGGDIRIGHTIGYTAEQVSVLLKQITTTLQPKPFDGRCPYKGLEVFEEEDAELFFGRERLVNELVGRVKESRTVFITGPSGSGKSSLVRAGLIHALKQGAIKSSDRWLYETMKPGREPLKDLSLAFSRLKSPHLQDYFLAHTTETDILNKCAESVLSGRKDQHFVLFVDQFEEIFTQINSEEERVAFINMLAHAGTIENGRVIILFAMRSDFVSNCATYPALNELLSQEFRQIGAMQPEELVSAIALPARYVGLPVEHELIARIINDMKGEPDALPLMQFALKDLFDAKQAEGGVVALTLKDYLGHGGIHKSLERHADATFGKLSESEQELTRSIFSGLIEIGRGTQDTKRTALFDELIPANTKDEDVLVVVQKLADARLIITDEQAGKDTVTISHEKLIEAWPWLKKLVNENRDVIALQNEIASNAKEWEDHQRDTSYLYTGARLANAREQLESRKLLLGGLAQAFIEASIKVHTDELEAANQRATQLRKQARRLTILWITTAVALVVMTFLSYSVIRQANIAREQANIALARQLAAQAQSINATRSSKQMIAVLLATQSMQILPSAEAAQVLLSNLAAHPITRMDHQDQVNSVAFSPDGKYVVSGSDDNTARVWEAATGKEIASIVHDDDGVCELAFSPDGKYVVSGGWDSTAHVWEAATGTEIASIVHDDGTCELAFSPDGKYVVSGGWDGTARVWGAMTGKEVTRLTHDNEVDSVAFSPDGKYVVSGSADHTARVWEAMTGKEVARMTHDSGVSSLAFSPDGKYVVSGSADHTARVWETMTGKEIARMTHGAIANSVAFSADGKYVISGSADYTARVWEAMTGKEVARITHDAAVRSVSFSPDDRYVVSGSFDNTARVWDAATGWEIARMTHDASVTSVAFSLDGKHVISGSADYTARVWEPTTRKQSALMLHSGLVRGVSFSPDGKYLVSVSFDNTARVWEARTGKEVARMTHDYLITSVAFSQDGLYVVTGSGDATARVWEAMTGKEVARMTHDDWVTSVAFSPNGKYVVSGSQDNTARVWEAMTGKEVARMTHDDLVTAVAFSPDVKYVVSQGYDYSTRVWEVATEKEISRIAYGAVYSIAFSPDGEYVVSGSDMDNTARVWEAMTGKEVAHMTHDDRIDFLAFSPDGKYVVSGSADHTARVWEAMTGKEVSRMTHDDDVGSVAFSPDGKYVVSGSADHTARVWEALTAKEIARMTHNSRVLSVAFSPDGRYIASGGNDNSARVWTWYPSDLIINACAFLPRNLTRAEWEQYFGNALEFKAICPDLPIEPDFTPTVTP